MKKSKKLMILGLSAATAAVAATSAVSSFAWFATNDTVTATGMKVKIQSASTLLIDTANSTATNGRLAAGSSSKSALTASGPADGLKPASTVDGEKWFTANAKDAGAYTAADKGYAAVETGKEDNYRLVNTFYLQAFDVTKTTGDATNKKLVIDSITVSYDTDDDLAPSFRVLTVIESNKKVFCAPTSQTTTGNKGVSAVNDGAATTSDLTFATISLSSKKATLTANNELVDAVTYNTIYKANVYIYFDGEDSTNFTDNIPTAEHLGDYSVTVSFSLVSAGA